MARLKHLGIRTVPVITFLVFQLSTINAETYSLQIVDSAGQPVPNAVISWAGESSDSSSDKPANFEIMDQVNKSFAPHVLVVDAGSSVSFPNSDSIHHHVYSFSPAKTFEIGLYSGEEAAPVSFDKPGVVVLGCNIHDVMVGYIYVNGSQNHGISDLQGHVSVDIPESAANSVQVWHVNLTTEDNLMAVNLAQVREDAGRIRIPVQAAVQARTASTPLEQRFEAIRKSRNGL